ncbi:transmembrane inner ear expressed protein [Mobula birostris]|uniref:transmembrane inner ear expressed protein n=1 Tax=Mobula birostris TaxID=1983395 RepID=UPI003B282DBF
MAFSVHWSLLECTTAVQEQSTTIPPKKPDPVTSETVVFWGLRLWQVVGVFSIFILAVIIVLCCIFKCRIPRTKKEIEARYAQRQAAKKYANTLDNVPPLNELTEMPGAAAESEQKDEVPTVSASISANGSKNEVKKKDGQKKDSTKDDRDGSKSKTKDGENKHRTRQEESGAKVAPHFNGIAPVLTATEYLVLPRLSYAGSAPVTLDA